MPEHHCRHCCTHKKSPRSYKIHRSPRSPRSPRSRRSPRSYKLHRSPRRRYRANLGEDYVCPICHEPANPVDGPLSARCDQGNELPGSTHYFHEPCLDGWINQNPPHSNKCPSCNSAPCRNLPPQPQPQFNWGLPSPTPLGPDGFPLGPPRLRRS